jgi:hypothetical protein
MRVLRYCEHGVILPKGSGAVLVFWAMGDGILSDLGVLRDEAAAQKRKSNRPIPQDSQTGSD